jgi:hypothetical protein
MDWVFTQPAAHRRLFVDALRTLSDDIEHASRALLHGLYHTIRATTTTTTTRTCLPHPKLLLVTPNHQLVQTFQSPASIKMPRTRPHVPMEARTAQSSSETFTGLYDMSGRGAVTIPQVHNPRSGTALASSTGTIIRCTPAHLPDVLYIGRTPPHWGSQVSTWFRKTVPPRLKKPVPYRQHQLLHAAYMLISATTMMHNLSVL